MAGLNKRINDYIHKDNQNKELPNVELGRLFSYWCLEFMFDKTLNEIEDSDIESGVLKVDGCSDGGVDYCFYTNGTLHIIQTKYNTSHKSSSFGNFLEEMRKLLRQGPYDFQKNELIEINDYYKKSDEVHIFYITNSKFSQNEKQKNDDYKENFISDMNNEKIKIYCLDLNGIDEYICQLTGEIPATFKNKKLSLNIGKSFINSEQTTLVAEVPIKYIASFVKEGKDYLYYSNIRNYLGKNKVNKKIVQTYENSPKNFWYYNNGVTIVCDGFDVKPVSDIFSICTMITPQIVNGCQTTKTIANCYSAQNEEKRKTKEGTILVKIINDKGRGRRDNITRYTNSQTAVSGKDFFALDEFHKKLKQRFSQLGYNYEIQKNSSFEKRQYSGYQEYSYLFDSKFLKDCKLPAKDVVQNFVAGFHQLPGMARNISNIVPGSKKYDEIFNDDTPEDPRVFLFPYAIMYYSKFVLKHNDDNNKKTTNLMFVSMYFNLLGKILKDYSLINTYEDILKFDNNIIDIIDSIFKNAELNKKLIQVVEEAQKYLFKDSEYKKQVGDNLPKFVKNSLDKENIRSLINEKIEEEYNDTKDDLMTYLDSCLVQFKK